MKKPFLFLLCILPAYFFFSLYFLDRVSFFCPVGYKGDMVIRSDSRGDGLFAAERSGRRLHQGIDLAAEIGAPVFASRSGFVVAAKRNHGMGNYVVIRHPGNFITIYGHLSEIVTVRGRFVRQGEVIGKVGKTGNANYPDIQPHLHFELKKDGMPRDPLEYLP